VLALKEADEMLTCPKCDNNTDFTLSGQQTALVVERVRSGEVADYDVVRWGEKSGRWRVDCAACGYTWEAPASSV
jgi:predicted nucleic-acid-binding Zn-ribbon protein